MPVDNLEGFFSAVGAIMTSQLRELALNSIKDYHKMFCPDQKSFSMLHFPGNLDFYFYRAPGKFDIHSDILMFSLKIFCMYFRFHNKNCTHQYECEI